MSNGVNRVTLLGNLGQDPEVRYTQNGNAVCNLRLAVNERRKDGDEWKEHVEWVTVVCFGKTAENAGQYLAKGRQIYVEGRMQTRKWTDRDGNDKWSTEVVANNIVFLGGGEDKQSSQRGERTKGERTKRERTKREPRERSRRGKGKAEEKEPDPPKDEPPPQDDGFYDDDLPF